MLILTALGLLRSPWGRQEEESPLSLLTEWLTRGQSDVRPRASPASTSERHHLPSLADRGHQISPPSIDLKHWDRPLDCVMPGLSSESAARKSGLGPLACTDLAGLGLNDRPGPLAPPAVSSRQAEPERLTPYDPDTPRRGPQQRRRRTQEKRCCCVLLWWMDSWLSHHLILV